MRLTFEYFLVRKDGQVYCGTCRENDADNWTRKRQEAFAYTSTGAAMAKVKQPMYLGKCEVKNNADIKWK